MRSARAEDDRLNCDLTHRSFDLRGACYHRAIDVAEKRRPSSSPESELWSEGPGSTRCGTSRSSRTGSRLREIRADTPLHARQAVRSGREAQRATRSITFARKSPDLASR